MNLYNLVILIGNMKFEYPSLNISQQIAYGLSAAIAIKLILTLRNIIPARVNCWFCNHNFWVPFSQRNSWDCRHCEQYNGFTKDGDYNKNIFGSSENPFVPKNVTVPQTPPKNGLCRMCNINQELKVFQLANFVPINENNFDDEVDLYRAKLEKAYKLCSPCKKHVYSKLQKEKSKLLDAKVRESQSPKKIITKTTHFFTKDLSQYIARVILICICLYLFCIATVDVWKITDCENMRANIYQGCNFIFIFGENILSIAKDKAFTTMPLLANYEHLFGQLPSLKDMENITLIKDSLVYVNWHMMEKLLSAAGCILQIMCHCCQFNTVRHVSTSDVVWAVNILSTLLPMSNENFVLLLKFLSAISLLTLYSIKPLAEKLEKSSIKKPPVTPKRMKNLTSLPSSTSSLHSHSEDDDSGDDVSLCKFGLNNTDSFNETQHSSGKQSGRTFSPFNRSSESLIWTPLKKLKTENQFISPEMSQSAFVKPQSKYSQDNNNLFKTTTVSDTYQKPSEYVADLDRSISGLSLGSSRNINRNSHQNIFTAQQFSSPTPTFVSPSTTSFSHSRPLISPSRFCAGTSWVAGGYWGSINSSLPDEQLYSRCSSQSSGFESLASSMQHVNMMNSCPPSATNSICSEMEYCDPTRTATGSNATASQGIPSFHCNGMRPPVHPQMLFNNHVQIPHLPQQKNLFAQSNSCARQNVSDWKYNKISHSHSQFTQSPSSVVNPLFTSRLIKLPNVKP